MVQFPSLGSRGPDWGSPERLGKAGPGSEPMTRSRIQAS